VEALGKGKGPAVRVTIGDYTYRSTVAVYGEEYFLPLSAENREKAGVSAGEEVGIRLELDTEPREVMVPWDLQDALDQDDTARCNFDRLTYSNKRRYVLQIEDAKTPETRERRIVKTVESLRAG
jgi:hypothetical protein